MPEAEGGTPARMLNWRVIGMTAGVVVIVLVLVMALPLIRAGADNPKTEAS